jgi:mono/diheme cytochrome c family protein
MNLRIDPVYSNRLRANLRSRADGILAGIAVLLLLATGCGVVRAETDREYCERQEGVAKTVCLRDLNKPVAASSKATTATPAAMPATTAPAATGTATTTAAAAPGGAAPYKVVDGYHVDPNTYKGFQTWRAAACDRCHGPNQEGLVGPSLVNSLKTLSKDDFVKTVTNGRLEKGMPSFASNQTVISSIDSLYSYLKGRSDGAITKAHVEQIN